MVGGRKTHDYPQGTPFPLRLLAIAWAGLCVIWVFAVPGHWTRGVGVVAAFFALAFVSAKLHKSYEQSGLAVPIAQPRVAVKFLRGFPAFMVTARIAFFVTVAAMIWFGVAPMATSTARKGIIACVFALIGVAVLNLGLEHHYVKIGRATEVDLSKSAE
jgi:hypothetical protein